MWDKKGENLTYKFFKLLAEQNRPKLAVIIGDSQTYHSGGALGKILKGSGYEVIKNYKAGENTNKTIQRLSKINLNKPVSLVVIFTGGNNPNVDFSKTATANLIKLIRRKFGQDVEIIIGTAPPARTGDPARVKKVFGRTAHPEAYKAKRRAMADAIVSTANSLDVKAVNPHTAGFLDDDINIGDGIHLTGSDAQNFAEAIASQISGKVNIQTPISAVIKDFSGKRLATDKLKGLDLVELARYAQSRATKCQGMDYLTINSKGDKVKQIQNKLTNLGFNPPNKDEEAYGTFDLRTLYNVLAFQKISDIRTDGCVGPETINAFDIGPTTMVGQTATTGEGYKIKQFKPYSSEAIELFRRAARHPSVNLPEEVSESNALHYILDRESKGFVGKPNYTFGKVHKNKNADQWGAIWDRLRKGEIWTKSTATGLGQLLSKNAKRFYPDGLQGIGEAFNEAVGMMAYIKKRYGSPEVARSVYGKKGNYRHAITGKLKRKGFKEGY
jgi:lysophospholipase L1-like esterase